MFRENQPFTLNSFIENIKELLDIQKGCDKTKTIENIRDNKRVTGANAWLLMCSIMIASLGLDLNSPAVIIGAMLISPLMSPILGVGLAIGTNDQKGLKIALYHFMLSIIIALSTSFIYFLLTPYGDPTSEILARTKPTFLDVLVAFFGGIAGIISGSRKESSNALPGVAIATALMPPLCVTGFGIAAGIRGTDINALQITLNSFYLFFINSFFIAVATYLIVRFLKFPYFSFMNKKEKRKTTMYISIVALLMIVPSFFILSSVIREVRLKENIDQYINEVFANEKMYVDEYQAVHTEDGEKLIVKVYGTPERFNTNPIYQENLKYYNLEDFELEILATSNIDLNKLKQLESKIADVGTVLSGQLENERKNRNAKDSIINKLENQLQTVGGFGNINEKIRKELKILFPDIEKIGFSDVYLDDFSEQNKEATPTLFIEWNNNTPRSERANSKSKIVNFLLERANLTSLEIMEIN